MNEAFKGNLKNTLIALAIFLGLALAYSYPALQGKVLNQHDFAQWKSMSWEPREHFEETGETPLWSNSMFGGVPTYTTYMAGGVQVMYTIQHFLMDSLPKPVMYFFFAMIGFFILLRTFKINYWWAVFGSIVYCFGTYNLQITAVGHETKMLSIAFMPIAIAGMIQLYRGKYIKGALLALIGLSLSIQNGMYQMLYYLLMILVLLGVGFLIKAILDKNFKHFGKATIIMLICGVLAVIPNLFGVALTKEYGKYTMRGGQSELTINKDEKEKEKKGGLNKKYAFSWSQSVGETFTLFVPNLYGGGSREAYWGPQPGIAGPIYFGILSILFMVLGLFVIRNRLKWVLFGIGIFGTFLAMGKHFSTLNYFLFDNLPMYNSFRTPTMAMTIAAFAFIFLAVWGVHVFVSDKINKDERWKSLKLSLIIVGGLTLLLGLGSGAFLDFRGENDDSLRAQVAQQYQKQGAQPAQIQPAVTNYMTGIYEQRAETARNDGFRSLFILVLGGLLLFLFTRGIIKEKVLILLLGIVFASDLLIIGTRYLKETDDIQTTNYVDEDTYDAQFAPRQVDLQIKQDTDPYYRVLDLSLNTYNNATQAIHHKCIGGYHPAKLENYQDLIDVQMTPGRMLNAEVLNMLNTKYIITQNQQVYPNQTACGNAWFVNSIKKVSTADEAMLALNAGQIGDTTVVPNSFKAKETAIIRAKELTAADALSFTKDSSSQIALTEYSLNHLNFESNNQHDGFAVFSDIYYPLGWKAYVDNKEAKIINTNYALRGIYIPAGNHKIKFEFIPETYTKLKWLPGVSSILILLIILGLGGLLLKKELQAKEV